MITRFYPYTLTLQAPLLITAPEGDANSVHSMGFIPGSTIRGAVASRLNPTKNAKTFKQYILSGQVCYLNAYPTVYGQRTLPMPVSLRQEKYGDTTHDLAYYSGQPQAENGWPDEQLQSAEAPFVSLDKATLTAAVATLDSRVHQQRDRSEGRAYTYRDPQQPDIEESRGTIFTYEALEAGQQFQGIIVIFGKNQKETDNLWQEIKKALGKGLSLGRSRNARYGGSASVTIECLRDRETDGATRMIRGNLAQGSLFCVLLTADYVGRNPKSGQSDPTAFRQDITECLGKNRVEVLRTRWAFRLVGGFNRKWGLQLPQTLALRAGSLLVLKAKNNIPDSDLLKIEQTGLGERRAEGFGRVVFLEKPNETCTISEENPSDPPEPEQPVSSLITTMQKRIVLGALEHRITQSAANLTRNAKSIPSTSLLGRLRVPLRKGAAAGLPTLHSWFDQDYAQHLRHPAMNQLNDCRIDGGRITLLEWIKKRVDTDDKVSDIKKILEMPRVTQNNYIVSRKDAESVLDKDTASELTLRLIDEVLSLLARQKRQKSKGGQNAND